MLRISNTLYLQLMIPITEILIRLLGIQRTMKALCGSTPLMASNDNDNIKQAKRALQSLIVVVERSYWKGNCLSRSIALHGLLQKKGISSTLCIGVRTRPKFKAHAWVEHKEIPLNAGPKVRQNYHMIENLQLIQRATFS